MGLGFRGLGFRGLGFGVWGLQMVCFRQALPKRGSAQLRRGDLDNDFRRDDCA